MGEIDAVRALREGDKKAFQYFFNSYYDRLMAYITTFTHNSTQSEDIVQQAFIDLWKDRVKLHPNKSPKNYLYSIAYHRYIDSVHKSKRRERLLDELWEKSLRDRIQADNEVLEKRVERIKAIMQSLPPRCKEIIYLNKVEGLRYKDIADKLQISTKTVESQMRIAFKKIREGFKDFHLVLTLFFSN
nr:RNA polymerase sigma-70 factor [Allomuricauda sp.]